jgi:hypothetical protein
VQFGAPQNHNTWAQLFFCGKGGRIIARFLLNASCRPNLCARFVTWGVSVVDYPLIWGMVPEIENVQTFAIALDKWEA